MIPTDAEIMAMDEAQLQQCLAAMNAHKSSVFLQEINQCPAADLLNQLEGLAGDELADDWERWCAQRIKLELLDRIGEPPNFEVPIEFKSAISREGFPPAWTDAAILDFNRRGILIMVQEYRKQHEALKSVV